MTKLDAVSLMFSLCGKLPPKALDTIGASNAALAERVLDLVDREVQSEGWHGNKEERVSIAPDGAGKIPVPADALEIDTDDLHAYKNLTRRGGFMFDLDNNTDVISKTLKFTITRKLAFTDLPELLAIYIATEAAVRYNRQHEQGPSGPYWRSWADLQARLEHQAAQARARAIKSNSRTRDVNVLDSAHARDVKGRYRRRFPHT